MTRDWHTIIATCNKLKSMKLAFDTAYFLTIYTIYNLEGPYTLIKSGTLHYTAVPPENKVKLVTSIREYTSINVLHNPTLLTINYNS